MAKTMNCIFPPHVNLMVMYSFSPHLNPTCVSTVHPPALHKQPHDPAIPSAVSHRFSVSLDTVKNYLQSRWPFSNSGFIHNDGQALMAEKCVKRRRNAARMQESSPCLLHYPHCHILFSVSDQERGPFGHETGRIMHPAKDGQVEQTYLLRSVIRGLVFCHNIAAWGQETPPDCYHFM